MTTPWKFISTVRRRAADGLKAHLRRKWKAADLEVVRARPTLQSARHVVVATVRNEANRLPYFLEYYRKLGFEHFILVDNASTDDTCALVSDAQDITLVSTSASYGAARYGVDWVNALLARHCVGKWILFADADEFLVFPHCDTHDITDLTSAMAAQGQTAMQAVMVDMYSDTSVAGNLYQRGADPLTVCNLFDRSGYVSRFEPETQTLWIKGGVRGRLYFDSPWDGPALNKTPLVRWGASHAFVKAHELWPPSLNAASRRPGAVSGALMHFKFLSDFDAKVAEEVQRQQHTSEYAAYLKPAVGVDPKAPFLCEHTSTFEGWRSFTGAALMGGVGWVSATVAPVATRQVLNPGIASGAALID